VTAPGAGRVAQAGALGSMLAVHLAPLAIHLFVQNNDYRVSLYIWQCKCTQASSYRFCSRTSDPCIPQERGSKVYREMSRQSHEYSLAPSRSRNHLASPGFPSLRICSEPSDLDARSCLRGYVSLPGRAAQTNQKSSRQGTSPACS
jgi:hypothetical protein